MKVCISDPKKVIETAFQEAENFEWTGWRIPVYCDLLEVLKGLDELPDQIEVQVTSAGGWLSNNSYQPGIHELLGVERWEDEGDGWSSYEDGEDIWKEKAQISVKEEICKAVLGQTFGIPMSFYWEIG